MKATAVCLGICAVGVLLIVAGLVWTNVIGDRMSWTEEQAIQFNQVSVTYHQAAHAHSDHGHDHAHDHGDHADTDLAQAKAAWQQKMSERDAAIGRRDFWKRFFLGGGMLAIMLGGAGYLIVKNVTEDGD